MSGQRRVCCENLGLGCLFGAIWGLERLFVREQKTVLLVNHAFARGTPAIFVIFVVSRGLRSKALVSLVRTQICHFRLFPQKPPFLAGQKHGLPKAPLLGPRFCANRLFFLLVCSGLGISPTIYRAQNPETPKSLKKVSREEFGTPRPRTPKKFRKSSEK